MAFFSFLAPVTCGLGSFRDFLFDCVWNMNTELFLQSVEPSLEGDKFLFNADGRRCFADDCRFGFWGHGFASLIWPQKAQNGTEGFVLWFLL
jgi:hypothetical protein